jgi:hypothetical protein
MPLTNFPRPSWQGNLHRPRPCFSGALPSLDRQGIIQGIYQRLWCKTDFETNFETMSAVFWYSLQGDVVKKTIQLPGSFI